MTYPAGEALVLTQLQNVTGFSAANTARASWQLLNGGASDHYAIIKPGIFSEDTDNNFVWVNRTIVQVWQLYMDDGTSSTSLQGYVNAVKDRFTKYRKLGSTAIIDSRVVGGSEMQERWNKDGALVWLSQDVILEWKEQEIVTYAE
jgi:hypothetical protein